MLPEEVRMLDNRCDKNIRARYGKTNSFQARIVLNDSPQIERFLNQIETIEP